MDRRDNSDEFDDLDEFDEPDGYDEYEEAVELWLRTEGVGAMTAFRADPSNPRALERLKAALDQWIPSHLGAPSAWHLEVIAIADEEGKAPSQEASLE
ncbi:hypothetical protein ICL81_03735 [Leucobacter sp. cx-328]|uniref:hypothetical protein n=1 Tax=unclassified Leucobacter TaxID=2621730 RepID=UPI00165DCC92|nr:MULTISPECIES: hypothetical protein [unclassified Leucobacter]MBC9943638.1 hypothetical protein [Leucobacter sp. cx-328]